MKRPNPGPEFVPEAAALHQPVVTRVAVYVAPWTERVRNGREVSFVNHPESWQEVDIEIRLDWIAFDRGIQSVKNKSGKSTALASAVVCKHVRPRQSKRKGIS